MSRNVYCKSKADPPTRLLKILDYDEDRKWLLQGAKALHPRCIAPIREEILCIFTLPKHRPLMEQRIIRQAEGAAGLKGISVKKGVYLVSMSTVGMWQQVGFCEMFFTIFAKFGLSLDLVTTSEANVTVSLDTSNNNYTMILDTPFAELQNLYKD